MATNSILKTVTIRSKNLGRGFVEALETASSRKGKKVVMSKRHRDLKGKAIRDVLKDM